MSEASHSIPAVLAVDGGNSKTDVAIVDRRGKALTATRVQGSSNAGLGHDEQIDAIDAAIAIACRELGIEPSRRPVADVGVYCLAGADFPIDDRRIGKEIERRGWTTMSLLRNDTFAVLRAGTRRGWGVAIVCGAGMNCCGVNPDGREVRYPALGEISGDLAAGGGWLGTMAVAHAVRSQEGRGAKTSLERLVPAYFGLARPSALVEAIYVGKINRERTVELAPLVFAAAEDGDGVAQQMVNRVADEVVAFAVATIRRLRLSPTDVEVIMGGGIFATGNGTFHSRIAEGICAIAPRAVLRRLDLPPVVGAALIGLDQLGVHKPTLALRITER
jgi:N-acetylglucosamine kinase-like BadF-type ATPase